MKKPDKESKIESILELIETPSYVCEEELLKQNLQTLAYVKQKSGAKILLALKGFAMWSTFGLVREYLDGACASGLWEAKLAKEELGKEVHTYSPAFKEDEIEQIASLSDHIVFNSFGQLKRYKTIVKEVNPNISIGIRINPEFSAAPAQLYNPCAPFSRLGVTLKEFKKEEFDSIIDGLHFHALCEESADSLEKVLKAVEEKFAPYIKRCKWVNFGGGHHITKEGYDIEKLISIILEFSKKYGVEVYLEPGEAVGWETGPLVASVIDIIENGMKIAILDVSAEAHMPDVLAMPYRPRIKGAAAPHKKRYTYRLGGNSCLAGDIIGDYSFDQPLNIGDKIVLEDMIHYTFVKNTTFNGLRLPSLALLKSDGTLKVVRKFGYEDYKNRLS